MSQDSPSQHTPRAERQCLSDCLRMSRAGVSTCVGTVPGARSSTAEAVSIPDTHQGKQLRKGFQMLGRTAGPTRSRIARGSGGGGLAGCPPGCPGHLRRQGRCAALLLMSMPPNDRKLYESSPQIGQEASSPSSMRRDTRHAHAGLGNDLDFKDMSHSVNKNAQFFKVRSDASRMAP